ncbi:hypothetical protein [Amycolatopsis sp. NPDC059021]|uniref:hypothetical protein n=1 Tax=Amycolatopsis sp. NPDC059021 TaxID=3346704 RepID=UPI0036706F81
MTDPHPESGRGHQGTGHRPEGVFDLIITTVDPRETDWLGHTDWVTVLTPRGLIAAVTHSDTRGGLLRDPCPPILDTVSYHGIRCLEHIAVLDTPLPHPATISADSRRTSATTLAADTPPPPAVAGPVPLRRVHHDLLVLGRLPDAMPGTSGRGRGETSDV